MRLQDGGPDLGALPKDAGPVRMSRYSVAKPTTTSTPKERCYDGESSASIAGNNGTITRLSRYGTAEWLQPMVQPMCNARETVDCAPHGLAADTSPDELTC